ncbi:MAG: glycosyltransferase family 4 protein [Kiritimatiellae bacterium]|nr:glycosyltransferase family 4 protein [Kiritimatiellia bacterium]MDD4341171.1 glycosyltransferase family 4 protein [Kiritimatiellia bacterium]
MKIAMVVPCYLPVPEGGAERQCRLQAQELARRGHAVTVYTRRWSRAAPRIELMGGVQVVRFGWFYPVEEWVWRLRRRLTGKGKGEYLGGTTIDQVRQKQAIPPKRRIRPMAILAGIGKRVHVLEWRWWFRNQNARPDVVHVHADTWEGALSAISGARWRCPVFIKPTLYPLRLKYARVPLTGANQSNAFDSVRYFALTPVIHVALREKGVEEGRIVDVPNGVEIPASRSDVRRKPIVLMVGNLTQGAYHKAFDVMLDAWGQIASAYPRAELLVAGAGDPSPWQALAEQLGCAGSVQFLGRVKEVGPLYDEVQVFCLPSREEGISNALLEAQSRGVACVVSDIRANRAVVTHGDNGWVVPVGDAEALALAVQKLLDDKPRRDRFGQNAVRRVAAEFEIGAIVSRVETAYQAAIESWSR